MLTGVNVKGLMRKEGLSIVKKFPKVKSDYVLTGSRDRYLVRLNEKTYTSTHQVKKNDEWVDIAKSVFRGSFEKVQEKCMRYIELLTKNNYR